MTALKLHRSPFLFGIAMIFNRRFTCAVFVSSAVVLLAAGCAAVTSNTATLNAKLSSTQEVPPTQSLGQGMATVFYNKETHGLRWKIDYSGLSGPATAGHFHGPAAMGSNAGVMVPFKTPLAYPVIEGETVITAAQGEDLMAGRWYINLHTAKNPGGEIRGQVTLTR